MKVVHVHLLFKHRDEYFGSVSAIFDYLSEQDVGITKGTLLHRIGKEDGLVVTSKAIIKRRELRTTRRNKD